MVNRGSDMVSINAINGASNQYQQYNQVNAIKPETKQELQALGINSQNIKTEAQAQQIIEQFKELQNVQNQLKVQGPQNVQDLTVTQQVGKAEDSQQTQAFAGGQAGAVQGQQPFQMANDITAQLNRLKLGLI